MRGTLGMEEIILVMLLTIGAVFAAFLVAFKILGM